MSGRQGSALLAAFVLLSGLLFVQTAITVHATGPAISTIVGNGTAGFSGDGLAATQAELNGPTGLAFNANSGYLASFLLYIADTNNNRIRVVNASGIISTFAGNGSSSGPLGDNGPATSATLNGPTSVAVDIHNNVYIADTGNNRIRKVDPSTGIITTILGGAISPAPNAPRGVNWDGFGGLFVADTGNNRILSWDATTLATTVFAGTGVAGYSGDNGQATAAQLSGPTSVGRGLGGPGSVIVADTGNNRLRAVDWTSRVITTLAGGGTSLGDLGPPTSAQLNGPTGLATNPNIPIFVTDTGDNRVRFVNQGTIATIAGNGTAGYGGDGGRPTAAMLNHPSSTIQNGQYGTELMISDTGNNRIRQVDFPAPAPAPTNLVAVAGDSSVSVSWTPPADDGGSPIIGYKVQRDGGWDTYFYGAATHAVLTGLINGQSHTFSVTSLNWNFSGGAVSSGTVTPTGSTSCPGAWGIIPSPNGYANNELNAVAATSPTDIWAAGDNNSTAITGNPRVTLAEHWDGSAWSIVSSPNVTYGTGTDDNVFASIAATSANDAWAVGLSAPARTSPHNTLAEHWNGTNWSIVTSPNGTGTANALFSVKGDSTSDYWAVGSTSTTTSANTLAEHWNGTSWVITATPSPSPYSRLIAVKVLSPVNVWAVGDQSPDNVIFSTLIEHWNGTGWSVVPSTQSTLGNGFLLGIDGTAGDLWAVGAGTSTGSGFDSTLIEHWNGVSWTTVSNAPSGNNTDLISIAAASPTSVWAVGATFGGTAVSPTDHTYVVHWDGTSWTSVAAVDTTTSTDLFDVAAIGSDVWAVGTYRNPGNTAQTLTENYCAAPMITSVTPANGPVGGGTAVTIAGSGLKLTTGVNFGTVAATSVTVISDSQVTAVSPSGAAGTTDVRIAYFGGLSPFSTGDQYTYNAAVPGAPTAVSATGGNGSATVSWSAPASDGGAAITAYVITPYIGSVAQTPTMITGSPPATTAAISGLSNGTTYTFKVAAQNPAGLGPQSTASNAVTTSAVAGAPTQVTALPGDTEATVTWTPPASNGGTGITSYVLVASPGGATTTVSAVTPAATITGLTNGTPYTFTVAAINAVGTGPASAPSAAVTPVAVAKGAAVAVLPAVTSGAYGGYLTVAYLENFNPTAAHIRVQYFDTNGNPVGTGNSAAGLPFWGTWTLRQDNADGLAAGQAGSAVVYSDQPLAIFVNEFAPNNTGDATSYTSIKLPAGAGATIYAPAIANGAYGGYTTGIGLINTGGAATDVRITYRDTTGTAVKIQTLTAVAANAYQGLYSGDAALGLPAGFAGTATIESTSLPAQPLAAVINEVGPGGQFSSYDAVPAGTLTVHAPVALNNAFGGYFTGMAIQNTGATAGIVTLTYYDGSGTLVKTVSNQAIPANGYLGVYQGDATLGPPASASGYTAVLSSTVPIAAIVNEVAPSSTSAKQSTAYNTFASGSSALNLPLVESAGSDGWSTGEGIMNTGSAATTVTVTYFDAATGAPIGTPQSLSLQPNAFWGLYQPAGGLPNGTRASAQVTTTGQPVAVICNESNATAFMSYSGQ